MTVSGCFRMFQDVSTLEDFFRFHKENSRAINRPWWEMCTLDSRNRISLVHASRKAAGVAVLSCEAHVDNRILDIQREKDLMEVSWLGWSILKPLIRFFNVFFPLDATWTLYRRVCAESWMMLSANRKLSRLFSLCFPFTWCSSFLHSTRKGVVPAAFEQSRRSTQRHCKTSWDNEKPRRLVLQLMKRMAMHFIQFHTISRSFFGSAD